MNLITPRISSTAHLMLLVSSAFAVMLAGLTACASPTPTPTPTTSPTPTATPTAGAQPTPSVFGPGGGPSFLVYDDSIYVELIVPEQVEVGEEVVFQLAFANVGTETKTFYHRADLAEFILDQGGKQVMTSHDQLMFGDIKYTNTLGPGQTRRRETGFDAGTFYGVLIDKNGQPLPSATYEIYGIAHMSSEDDGTYESYATPKTTIEIVSR